MTSPFDPNWRPPSPRVSGGQIGIAVGIGVGLMIVTYVLAGIVIGTSIANGPSYAYTPYPSATQYGGGDFSPLTPGSPGSPVALAPMTCAGACFDKDSVEQMILVEPSFVEAGLDSPDIRWGVDRTHPAHDTHVDNVQSWADSANGPDECFPTWPKSPDATAVDSTSDLQDPVGRMLLTSGPDLAFEQDARIFPDVESAASYLADVSTSVAACPHYVDPNTYPTDAIVPEAALDDLPASVAAIGFVRKAQVTSERDYVFDVQRGNVVIRSTLHASGGEENDVLFRQLMSNQADAMAQVPAAAP